LDFEIFFPLMQLPKVLLLFELYWEIVLITLLVINLSKFQKTTTVSTVVSQNYNSFSPFQKTTTFVAHEGELWRSGKSVALWPWVQALETTSCINVGKGCVRKTQSGRTLPQTLRKQELCTPDCPL
jgi:hypothetical protein